MTSRPSTTSLLDLPWIPSLEGLADQLGLSHGMMHRLYESPSSFYKQIYIPKRHHGYRLLHIPSRPPKAVQAWILENILRKVPVDSSATAYRKGTCLRDNVSPHRDSKVLMHLDLVAFFDSINTSRVTGIFAAMGYPPVPSTILARLCTVRDRLPQGGVTSPALSNLACVRMDRRIRKYVRNHNVIYTRYADDITLSAMNANDLFGCVKLIKRIIHEEGFTINGNKTRVAFSNDRHVVTGLVIGQDREIRVSRAERKRLRACMYKLEKERLSADKRSELGEHVRGWLAYLKSVDRHGLDQLQRYQAKLRGKRASRSAAAGKSPPEGRRSPP